MTTPPDAHPTPPRRRRWPALLALVLGVALVVIFGLRAWRHIEYNARVERGEVQVEALRGWMTLAYIARVYGVPEIELRQALGLPATGFDDRSVRAWSEAAHLDPEATRHIVEKLILERSPPSGAAR
jgi:hypothetical protein